MVRYQTNCCFEGFDLQVQYSRLVWERARFRLPILEKKKCYLHNMVPGMFYFCTACMSTCAVRTVQQGIEQQYARISGHLWEELRQRMVHLLTRRSVLCLGVVWGD